MRLKSLEMFLSLSQFDSVGAILVDQKKMLETEQSPSVRHWRTANHGERPQRVRLANHYNHLNYLHHRLEENEKVAKEI